MSPRQARLLQYDLVASADLSQSRGA